MDIIISSAENKTHVIGLFAGISEALDTLGHGVMLCKSSYQGIQTNALTWSEINIWGHQQYISCGVPRGSTF